MDTNQTSLFSTYDLIEILTPVPATYLVVSIILLFIARIAFNLVSQFDLANELTNKDNKAVAVSFSGYLFGIAIIIWGVLTDPYSQHLELGRDIIETIVWTLLGIILLILSKIINDKLVLNTFNTNKELIDDKNIGTGAVQAGTFLTSALIIKAALLGETQGYLASFILVILYYAIGQLFIIIYSRVYQATTKFCLHKEIEKDNYSAGISFGLSLISIGLIISSYIERFDSLIGLVVWFIICLFGLVTSRYIVDKLILPGPLLDDEIEKDQNWGAALIEGLVAIGLTLILTASF